MTSISWPTSIAHRVYQLSERLASVEQRPLKPVVYRDGAVFAHLNQDASLHQKTPYTSISGAC
ncbi:hypothetical protein [Yersinia similis]|uniref:hypothetical protein n=1 Tax=Yersinia similis TaxID=367190 RepID=UPI0011A72E2B|nr:hypothetical protein [Yersinia similis]